MRAKSIRRWVDPAPYLPKPAFGVPDWAMAAIVAVAGVAVALYGMSQLSAKAYASFDIYFQADGPRIMANLFDRDSIDHQRSNIHPLFSLLLYPPANLLKQTGLAPLAAAQVLTALAAAGAPALLYFSLRGWGLPRAAATLFALVLIASATFIHWFAFVETFAFSALSIALMLCVLSCARSGGPAWIVASAATLAFTVTNWAFGVMAVFARHSFRGFALITAGALAMVTVLAMAQNLIFPHARLFFNPGGIAEERQYTQLHRDAWTPRANLRSAIITSAVAPAPQVTSWEIAGRTEPYRFVNNQYSPLSSTTPAGLAAAVAWLGLLALGAWGGWRERRLRPVVLATGGYVAVQLALHLVYGEVTFLYAAHFFPALVAGAAFSWFTRLRWLAVALAASFVVLAGFNNLQQFNTAATLTNDLAAARTTVR